MSFLKSLGNVLGKIAPVLNFIPGIGTMGAMIAGIAAKAISGYANGGIKGAFAGIAEGLISKFIPGGGTGASLAKMLFENLMKTKLNAAGSAI